MTVITMGTNWILAYNLMISKEIVHQTKIIVTGARSKGSPGYELS
jgi:hypothetical protein